MGSLTDQKVRNNFLKLPLYVQEHILSMEREILDLKRDLAKATSSPVERPKTNVWVPKFRDPLGWEPSNHDKARIAFGTDPERQWIEVGRENRGDEVLMRIYGSSTLTFIPSSSNFAYAKLNQRW